MEMLSRGEMLLVFRGSGRTVFSWVFVAVIAVCVWYGATGEIAVESATPSVRLGPELIDAIQSVASRPWAVQSVVSHP